MRTGKLVISIIAFGIMATSTVAFGVEGGYFQGGQYGKGGIEGGQMPGGGQYGKSGLSDSSGSSSKHNSKYDNCVDATDTVIGVSRVKNSAGHCGGYIAGSLTNQNSSTVHCNFNFTKGGVLDIHSGGAVSIKPGQKASGDSDGIWSCGASQGDSMVYACTSTPSMECNSWISKKAENK